MTSILLVGAFERDNFGDLLLMHATREFLRDVTVLAGTPFRPSPASVSEHPMERYADILAKHPVDVIWSVGGEIGGTPMEDAYIMSASEQEYRALSSMDPKSQRRAIEASSSRSFYDSPYMPRIEHSDSSHVRHVINSAGVSGVGHLRGRALLRELAALRRATHLSVRDARSHRVLRTMGIRSSLAPDIVHTLGARYEDSAKLAREPLTVLFQASLESLQRWGIGATAEALQIAALRGWRLILFAAGTARGHDSRQAYEELRTRLLKDRHFDSVEIDRTSTAQERADRIAIASLWMGTSLHGTIVATAARTPRLSISNIKLARYAKTWEDPFPASVELPDLSQAVEYSLKINSGPEADAYRSRTMNLATANIQRIIGSL